MVILDKNNHEHYWPIVHKNYPQFLKFLEKEKISILKQEGGWRKFLDYFDIIPEKIGVDVEVIFHQLWDRWSKFTGYDKIQKRCLEHAEHVRIYDEILKHNRLKSNIS